MAANAVRLLCLTAVVAGAVASFSAHSGDSQGRHPVTATVAGSVKEPPAVKRAKFAATPVAKRPVKARPRAQAPAAPNDPLWSSSWSLTKTHAVEAWKLTTGGPETVVAILDTGVDLGHPDLQGSFVPGYDFVNGDGDPSDDQGHGTLVAGVVAARANNGLGGVGACSGCSLIPVKVIAGNGSGSASDIAAGIRWAADNGADIINMSFTLSGPDDGVAAAIANAQGRGALIVAAAGNAGTADVTYPAAYPGVLSVTATDQADERYSWSSYGSWVRLAAPGCSVATGAGGTFSDFCGTSSATALVSGLAALIRSYAPAMTVDELGQALAANALKVGDFVSAGRVDVEAAVGSLTRTLPAPDPIGSSTPGADQRD